MSDIFKEQYSAAILSMLNDDPNMENQAMFQVESDGTKWPRLGEIARRLNISNAYAIRRVAAMKELSILPEGY